MDTMDCSKKTWEPGIPSYSYEDMLSKHDIFRYVIDYIKAQEFEPQGISVLEECIELEETPYIVCNMHGNKTFITIRMVLSPEEIKPLQFTERKKYIERAEGNNVSCYYAEVLVKPADSIRAEKGLFLQDDELQFTCEGLKEIKNKVSETWINVTLDKITQFDPHKGDEFELPDLNPSIKFSKEDVQTIKFALSDNPQLSSEFKRFTGDGMPKTFQEKLLDFIKESGMTNPEFYNAAMIDRKLFSAIKNNPGYKPKKETAVACCFGLGLSLKEAEQLLGAAGFKLSLSILWDRIVYFCLDHRITDLDVVNELLYAKRQKCIGVIE